MKYAALLGGLAAATLAACSGGESPAPEASETAAAEATEAAAPAAAAVAGAPTKEFLVGKWGEGDGCELPMTFNADGTITDGPADTWTLEGNKLTLGGMFSMELTVVDDNTMASKNEGGGQATLKRCG